LDARHFINILVISGSITVFSKSLVGILPGDGGEPVNNSIIITPSEYTSVFLFISPFFFHDIATDIMIGIITREKKHSYQPYFMI